MDDLKNKFIKSVFWLGSAKFLGQAFSWLVTIALVRILSPQDFGILAMASAYQAIIVIIYDLNLGAALVQKKELTRLAIQTTYWFILGFSLFLYLLTLYLAPYIATFFQSQEVTAVLRVYAIGTVFQSIQQVPYWLMSKQLDFDKRAKAEFASNVIAMGISLVLALAGYGIWSLVFGFVTKQFFQAILVCYFFNWSDFFSWKEIFSFSWLELSSLLRFSLPLTGFYSLRYIFMRSDSIIVGKVLGDRALGYYSVALDLARIPVDKFITIINQVCFPVFSELQGDLPRLKRYFFKTIEFVSLIVFPISTGAALLSNEMIILILTPKWLPILYPFICLCFVAILQSLSGIIFMLMNALGKSKVNFRFSVISAIILPIVFLVGVRYDVIGIAISWAAIYPLLFLYLLYRANLEIQARFVEFIDAIRAPFYGTIFMAISVLLVKQLIGFHKISFESLLLYIFVGFVAHASYIYFFSRSTIDDIKGIYSDLRSRRKVSPTLSVSR